MAQVQHGSQGPGEVLLGRCHGGFQVLALGQVRGDGAGQGAACAVGVGVLDSPAGEPPALPLAVQVVVGVVEAVAALAQHGAQNVVVDPVMVATSGSRLLESDAATALREELFPLATVVTPNIPEAQALSGWEIFAPVDMERAAQRIGDAYGCAVLCKGGHSLNDANDYLYRQGQGRWFPGRNFSLIIAPIL